MGAQHEAVGLVPQRRVVYPLGLIVFRAARPVHDAGVTRLRCLADPHPIKGRHASVLAVAWRGGAGQRWVGRSTEPLMLAYFMSCIIRPLGSSKKAPALPSSADTAAVKLPPAAAAAAAAVPASSAVLLLKGPTARSFSTDGVSVDATAHLSTRRCPRRVGTRPSSLQEAPAIWQSSAMPGEAVTQIGFCGVGSLAMDWM